MSREPVILSLSKDHRTRFDKLSANGSLRVLLDPPGEPQANMDRDEELARQVRAGLAPLTLRIYGWARLTLSIGRRQSADDLPPDLLARRLPMVHRPTGGGAVVHTLEEVTYSLSMSRSSTPRPARELPILFHQFLKEALMDEGLVLSSVEGMGANGASLCFESPICGDLLYQGRKVAGAALRIWREGVLIQGSLQGLPVEYNGLAQALTAAAQSLFQQEQNRDLARIESRRLS